MKKKYEYSRKELSVQVLNVKEHLVNVDVWTTPPSDITVLLDKLAQDLERLQLDLLTRNHEE